MKKIILPLLIAVTSTTLLTGCLALSLGSGETHEVKNATVGQQLVDLQKAKDAGAITDAEFQAQKAKILGAPAK
jgi:hypothetical protein